jgi:predicted TIM-barrel fold metal-dependent hydrolase
MSSIGAYRTIGVEDHLVTPEVLAAWDRLSDEARADSQPGAPRGGELTERLLEVGERRLVAMDDAGLDVQVLSLTSPALHNLPAVEARSLQVATNDYIAARVAEWPDRLQGFATLGMPDPDAAAAELERAVSQLGLHGALLCGRTGPSNLDDAANWPVLEVANERRAPLYIHPQMSQPGVRDALYGGFDEAVSFAFATSGIGWHYESGVQFLRLALSGALDRFPNMPILLGHWGEVVLFYLDRLDSFAARANLPLSFSEYARRHVYATAGGLYSERYLNWAAEVLGAERLLFGSDYPYRPGPGGGVAAYLRRSGLSPEDQARVASGNWDALVAAIRR